MKKETRTASATKHPKIRSRVASKVAHAVVATAGHVASAKLARVRSRFARKVQIARTAAVEGAKAADKTVRAKPYRAIGIAVAAGALLGALASRRSGRN